MLSEDAERLLRGLREQRAALLCPECAAREWSLPKWDVLKLIRELIGTGSVRCFYAFCLGCANRH
jgi:hypothetical protein